MFGRIRRAAGNIANRVRSAFNRQSKTERSERMAAKREKPTLPTDTDWPAETVTWFNAWRDDRCSDRWDERQWQYVMDTAIVHALVYGSNDFGALAELDKRLRFMGSTFED